MTKPPEAKRNPVSYRYDILVPEFIHALAEIASYGAAKYGEFNWQESRLIGDKSPINHALNHITSYMCKEEHDKLNKEYYYHLASAAFNLMMEFWYCTTNKPVVPSQPFQFYGITITKYPIFDTLSNEQKKETIIKAVQGLGFHIAYATMVEVKSEK